ncbi:MAG: methyltransferase domain-containing protein [Candidatus Thorarchaeota archaeon]
MFLEEALWIKKNLFIQIDDFDSVLDIGSSSAHFREVIQPHIYKELFKPLKESNKKVFHLDKKAEVGVDIVLDIEDLGQINQKFDVILCCNVLEHVRNPLSISRKISRIIDNNGFLIVTVPHAYPYHSDPFDNMWRPSPKNVAQIFNKFMVVESQVIKIQVSWKKFFFRRLFSIISSFRSRSPKIIFKNLKMILRHPFSVTCVFFKSKSEI